jgi:hypothetical protein
MNYINIFIIFSSLIYFAFTFSFNIPDTKEKYCFSKYIQKGDHITMSFMVSSSQKELIHVSLTFQKDKNSIKQNIYEVREKESGDYNSPDPTEEGYYELCFYSKKGKDIFVNMEFFTLYEEHDIKKIATDKEIKTINDDIKEVRDVVDKIESNARHLNTRKYNHLNILKQYITSIKRLTYLKIFAVALLSLFQIYVVQKFFGPNKRVSTIKGVFSGKDGVL